MEGVWITRIRNGAILLNLLVTLYQLFTGT
jgi:hypothetical protein